MWRKDWRSNGGEEAAALSAFEADCKVRRMTRLDDGEMKCCNWATEKIHKANRFPRKRTIRREEEEEGIFLIPIIA